VALEVAEFGDASLERVALALEPSRLVALLGLRLALDAVDLGLSLGDELSLLGLTLCNVLVVQALRQLDNARGSSRRAGSDLNGGGRHRGHGSRSFFDDGSLLCGGSLTGLVRGQLRLQLGILFQRLAPLDDDFV